MGMWKKIAGIGLAAAGVMTSNPALIGMGASIVAGDIQAEGAKKAADQQQVAADKSLALQTQVNKETQQTFSPYTQSGNAAMGTLGNLLGLPQSNVGYSGATAGQQMAAGVRPVPADMVGAASTAETDKAGAPAVQRAQSQMASSYGPTGRLGQVRNGGLVQMRAPTGETQWVPQEQAEYYRQRGATLYGFAGGDIPMGRA